MGDDGGERFQFGIAAGKLFGPRGHGLLQAPRVAIDEFQACAVDVPQQFAGIAELFQIGKRAQHEGFLDGIGGGGAGIDNHANPVVEAADALQELRPANVGEPQVQHGHAEIPLLDVLQSLAGRIAADHVKAMILQTVTQQLQLRRIVFHHQHLGDSVRTHRRGSSERCGRGFPRPAQNDGL